MPVTRTALFGGNWAALRSLTQAEGLAPSEGTLVPWPVDRQVWGEGTWQRPPGGSGAAGQAQSHVSCQQLGAGFLFQIHVSHCCCTTHGPASLHPLSGYFSLAGSMKISIVTKLTLWSQQDHQWPVFIPRCHLLPSLDISPRSLFQYGVRTVAWLLLAE